MYDYHTHSIISDDGNTPMLQMVEAGISVGLKEIAITDHFDPDYPDPNWSSDMDFDGYHKQLEETAVACANRIKVIRGIEIGIQHGETLTKCRNAARSYGYDFVIGSFHCAEGIELSQGGFFDHRSVEESTSAFYRYVLSTLKEYDDFDVLGHINVIDRYGAYIPDYSCCNDIVTEILKLLIEKGKGIEINTSSFRYGMDTHTTPTDEILALYRSLGGEIITIGSDAHSPRHVGYKLSWALEKMRQMGFRYLTTFDQRIPRYLSI